MGFLIKNYIKMRNLFWNNFFVTIYSIVTNNRLIHLDSKCVQLLLLLIKFIPFYITSTLLNQFNMNVIYQSDSIYNITNTKQLKILPIILKMSVSKTMPCGNLHSIDINDIKYYNSEIPLQFLLKNHNVLDYESVDIKYMTRGKIVEKKINIAEYNNKFILCSIYSLFE